VKFFPDYIFLCFDCILFDHENQNFPPKKRDFFNFGTKQKLQISLKLLLLLLLLLLQI